MINSDAPTSKLTGVPGWETPAEQALLVKYALTVPAGGIVLEIGSEFGMSASILRKKTWPNVEIHCVEINPKAPFMANLKEANLDFGVYPHFTDSQQYYNVMSERKVKATVDLAFVDGDHSFAGALKDLQGVSPLLKKGAYLLVHDTACATNHDPHPLHYEVSKAIHQWWHDEVFSLVETADSIMVFKKVVEDA